MYPRGQPQDWASDREGRKRDIHNDIPVIARPVQENVPETANPMSREILDECIDFILRTDDPVAERTART
jgi:hypothetical protein